MPPDRYSGDEIAREENGHRRRRRWTREEDDNLIAAVEKYGPQRGPGSQWSKISQGLPGRTNKDCRKRWFHSLDPNVRKGKWSAEEDEALRRLYAEMGPQWKEIALRIPGRKDDQVSKRWRDVLAPELTSKKPWTDDEDALLLKLVDDLGPKWTAIAEQLPGRSPIACRNRSRKYRNKTDPSTPAGSKSDSTHEHSPHQMELDFTPPPPDLKGDHWQLPDLAPQTLQMPHFTFDPSTISPTVDISPPMPIDVNVSAVADAVASAVVANAVEAAGTLESWLATVNVPAPPAAPVGVSPPLQVLYGHSETPVNNMWSLLLALDRGEESVNVTAPLLRQLLATTNHTKLKQSTQLSVELH